MNSAITPMKNPKPNTPMISIHIYQTRRSATKGSELSYVLKFTPWTAVQVALDHYTWLGLRASHSALRSAIYLVDIPRYCG